MEAGPGSSSERSKIKNLTDTAISRGLFMLVGKGSTL